MLATVDSGPIPLAVANASEEHIAHEDSAKMLSLPQEASGGYEYQVGLIEQRLGEKYSSLELKTNTVHLPLCTILKKTGSLCSFDFLTFDLTDAQR